MTGQIVPAALAGVSFFCFALALFGISAIRDELAKNPVPEPSPGFDEATTGYRQIEADGPIARLQRRLDRGEARIEYDSAHGYLRSVLQALDIPESSQVLVFSKTSSQRERISPRTPRAVYFNHEVYLAYIPGSPVLEISCADRNLGTVFYTLGQEENVPARFSRQDQCLECHTSFQTLGVPGHLLRSVGTDENGVVDLSSSVWRVNHSTPLAGRWGGWYVCGLHGDQTHRGNLIGKGDIERLQKEPNHAGNLTELGRILDTSNYPGSSSDIVALMILDHQIHMQNLITRLRYEAGREVRRQGDIRELDGWADILLRYLLFIDEAPLTQPIQGISRFAEWFQSQGPKDAQGRSLRQLDLQTRLFKYPCSHLIYSEPFEDLPRPMKLRLYRRLWRILNGDDPDPDFQQIPLATRKAILEILIGTKSDLPVYWTL